MILDFEHKKARKDSPSTYDGFTPAVDSYGNAYVYSGVGSQVPIIGQLFAGGFLVTDPNYQWNGYTMNSAVVLGPHADAFSINDPGDVYPIPFTTGRLIQWSLQPVAYDYQLVTRSNGKKVIDANASLTVPVWLRSLFSDDFFCSPVSVVMRYCVIDESHFVQMGNLDTVTSVTLKSVRIISSKDGLRRSVQDSDLAALGKMTQLQSLELRSAKIEGFGLAPFANLRHLRTVTFCENLFYPTPPEVLEQFGKITSLESLDLGGCSIDDAELSKLRNLSNLKVLWLNFTDISDAGLKHLAGFTKLTHLYLNGDNVTAEGIRDLKNRCRTVKCLVRSSSNRSSRVLPHAAA